jgi:hypothetical protein
MKPLSMDEKAQTKNMLRDATFKNLFRTYDHKLFMLEDREHREWQENN